MQAADVFILLQKQEPMPFWNIVFDELERRLVMYEDLIKRARDFAVAQQFAAMDDDGPVN
jgi:hypothetical protein